MVGILIFKFYLMARSASINLHQKIIKKCEAFREGVRNQKNSTVVSCVVFLGPHSSQLYP